MQETLVDCMSLVQVHR